ncbi:unnamed protein product [Symbiodinium pilosum]|uniref:Major facilitator superfamily (MFS) profile domain-containing protein n=1 Tax=Symbiodinium pilosum TaxID=2952 RepID=A0A812VQV9_SYMPI|nr:unnamed protein product [Symbiodinium pilosum]
MASQEHDLDEEMWEENASLRKQLADAQHRLQNLNEQYKEETFFWRSRALELQLEFAKAAAATNEATEANGRGRNGSKEPEVQEDSKRRAQHQDVEKQLEELHSRKQEAETRLARSERLSEQLKEQACEQAVQALTRDGFGPAETFASSLSEVEAPTLRWAQHQIEMRWRQLASARKGSGKGDPRWKQGSNQQVPAQVITCSLPYLPEDGNFEEVWETKDCGFVLGFAALAAALGYGVHGPCIDRFGVMFGLCTALGGCCLGVATLATAQTQAAFVAGSALIRFSYAAGWPAEMKALKLLVPDEYQGMAVSALGFASRGGAILGRGFFGVLLRSFTWRQIAWQAAQVLFAAGGLAVLVMRGLLSAKSTGKASSAKRPMRGIREALQEPAVWLVTAAFACLCHVQHADDFMPLLFQGLTKSKSVVLSCVYPGGGIAAMLLNAWRGYLLQHHQREQLYVASSVLAALLLGLLLFLSASGEIFTVLVASSLFLVAFCCAFPYYLVPNLFAFDLMGTECATLIGFFELTSFCSMMPAHMVLLRIAGTYGWTYALLQMVLTMCCAAIFLSLLIPKWRAIAAQGRGPTGPAGVAVVEDGHVTSYTQLRPAGSVKAS